MYKEISNVLEDNFKYIKYDEMVNFIRETVNGNIPKKFPFIHFDMSDIENGFEFISEMYFAREVYTRFCSWPIITDDWVSQLAEILKNKKCIEVMAGHGLLSYALQQHDIDITAYDNYSWSIGNTYTTVYTMDAVECADKLDYDYIICSWPPYEEKDICRVVRKMYYKKPNSKLIYIGEPDGGCTACFDFFDIVNPVDTGFESISINKANECFTNFYGIHDSIYLFKPNNKVKSRKFK